MKKKTKKLLLLAAILGLLVGGYFALDFLPKDTGEEENTLEETVEVAEFTVEDIAFYCYKNPEYEMGFYCTEEGYVHYRDESFPANEEVLEAQLEVIGNLVASQKIDSTDKAEYGLDSPELTVAVTLKDGTERTFFLGDKALFEEGYYLLDVENNAIYLTDTELYEQLNCFWSSLVQQEDKVLVSGEQILDVTVETAGVQTMYISYEEAKEHPWQLTTPEGTFDGDSDAVLEAISVFNSYSLLSTLEYNCDDFTTYGLEEPVTIVRVRYTEEESTDVKTLLFEFGSVDPETDVSYVRINGSSYVYGMSEYYVEKISVFDAEELKYVPEENQEEAE